MNVPEQRPLRRWLDGAGFPLLLGTLVVLLNGLLLAWWPAGSWLVTLGGMIAGGLLLLPLCYFRSFPHPLPRWAYLATGVGMALLVGSPSVWLAWQFVPLGASVVVGMDVRLLLAR